MALAPSEPITEVVYIPLRPGFDLSNPADKEAYNGLHPRPNGLKTIFSGFPIEKTGFLQEIIDWEHTEGRTAYSTAENSQAFSKHLCVVKSDAPEQRFHVRFGEAQGGQDPRDAGVTEVISAYFDPMQDQEKWVEEHWKPFVAACLEIKDSGIQGIVGGWSIEGHTHEYLGNGVQGKMFMVLIGWPDVETHMEFRKTEGFKKAIPLFRAGPVALLVHHTKFERV